MKAAKIAAWLFGAAGAVIMGVTLMMCLLNLDRPVRMRELPEEAVARSEVFVQALEEKDLQTASRVIYGQPKLGTVPGDAMSQGIWEMYMDSLSFSFTGECYATDQGVCRDGTVTALNVPRTLDGLKSRARDLLEARVATANGPEEIFDENYEFREDLLASVLNQAMTEILIKQGKTVTRQVTVKLVRGDGQWWVVPDQALQQALSGGLG